MSKTKQELDDDRIINILNNNDNIQDLDLDKVKDLQVIEELDNED